MTTFTFAPVLTPSRAGIVPVAFGISGLRLRVP